MASRNEGVIRRIWHRPPGEVRHQVVTLQRDHITSHLTVQTVEPSHRKLRNGFPRRVGFIDPHRHHVDEWRDCGILVVLLKYTVDRAPCCDKNSYWIENVHMGACFLWALKHYDWLVVFGLYKSFVWEPLQGGKLLGGRQATAIAGSLDQHSDRPLRIRSVVGRSITYPQMKMVFQSHLGPFDR